MKNSLKVFAVLAVALLLSASTASAASPWTMETTYGKKVAGKLDFGVKNLLGGWMAILPCKSGCDVSKEGCPGMCCAKNLGMGLVNAVVYTVGGALHVVTFPIPVDVPLPNNGIQI